MDPKIQNLLNEFELANLQFVICETLYQNLDYSPIEYKDLDGLLKNWS